MTQDTTDYAVDVVMRLQDTIRSQRAEIDRLTAERDEARAENERLREAASAFVAHYQHGISPYLNEAARLARAALQPTPASWGAAGVQMTIAEPEGSHD